MKTNEERIQSLLSHLDGLSYIKPEEIPGIQLYMDQVTTFMDEHLQSTKRYPEDKVLTKTMINNYAKNNLLPPPVKKKYSKEHMLMLIFIYYFKNLLSFNDIEQLFKPVLEHHFAADSGLSLEDIYREVFSLENSQMTRLKEDVAAKLQAAESTFQDTENAFPDNEEGKKKQEYLRLFAFICELSFDVYLKKQMIEMLADQLRSEEPPADKHRK